MMTLYTDNVKKYMQHKLFLYKIALSLYGFCKHLPKYIEMVREKFGLKVVKSIHNLLKIKLKRKYVCGEV